MKIKYKLGYPLDFISVSSPYGDRIHPITQKLSVHQGVDYRPKKRGYNGDTVMAIFDGVVKISKMQNGGGGWGNYIVIENKELGLCTVDAHLSKRTVKAGQKVVKGQKIGEMGTSGSSTGTHLHHGVFKCSFDDFFDKYVDNRGEKLFKHAVNPKDYDGRVIEIGEDDSMKEKINLKFKSDGRVIKGLDKDTVDRLSTRLDEYTVYLPPTEIYKYCGVDLQYGDWEKENYDDVLKLQMAINVVRMYYRKPKISEDGMFGNECKEAVIGIQSSNGLTPNGVVDIKTSRIINDLLMKIKG